uniref:Uncharacterized protein n=1 Tax=Myotis myotis TaxID=51298 RepID=A0A7J7ZXT7_MYOMY|nr:hypothetical protein mMyoMyo1_009953 [Myotis myotis]
MNDLLEESQNSWKVIILMVMVYYKERLQSKIEQRKNGRGQSPGKEPNMELLLPSSGGVHICYFCGTDVRQYTCSIANQGSSLGTTYASVIILNFSFYRTVRNKCLFFKPSSLLVFCYRGSN